MSSGICIKRQFLIIYGFCRSITYWRSEDSLKTNLSLTKFFGQLLTIIPVLKETMNP